MPISANPTKENAMNRVFASIGLIFIPLHSMAAADKKPGALTFSELQNEGDDASAEAADGKTMLRIKCPRGIGHCTVSAKKGEWPEHVEMLLEKFDELEHFEFATGRMRAQGSRKSSKSFELFFLDD